MKPRRNRLISGIGTRTKRVITSAITATILLGNTVACSPAPPRAAIATAEVSPAPAGPATFAEPNPPARSPIVLTLGSVLEIDGLRLRLVGYAQEMGDEEPEGSRETPAATTVRVALGDEVIILRDPPASERIVFSETHRIELVRHDVDEVPWVAIHLDALEPGQLEDRREVRVVRDGTIDLGDGTALRFVGHSRKHDVAGGPPAPMMVEVAYERESRAIEQARLALEPPRAATWRWRDRHFRLVSYEYDRSMVLEVARIRLRPLVAER